MNAELTELGRQRWPAPSFADKKKGSGRWLRTPLPQHEDLQVQFATHNTDQCKPASDQGKRSWLGYAAGVPDIRYAVRRRRIDSAKGKLVRSDTVVKARAEVGHDARRVEGRRRVVIEDVPGNSRTGCVGPSDDREGVSGRQADGSPKIRKRPCKGE